MHWYKAKIDGTVDYVCQDDQPAPEFISGPAPLDGKVSNMIWDAGLGQVRAKTQDELDADAAADAAILAAQAAAKAELEAVSPAALSQLVQDFTDILDAEPGITTGTKTALSGFAAEAMGRISSLRNAVVLLMGGEIG